MIRSILITLTMLLVLANGCSNPESVYVEVVAQKDTVKSSEMYVAEIQLRNYEYTERFVENYLVRKADTVMLDWDDNSGYGIYRATSAITGDRFFEGFVVYQNDGISDTLYYRKEYYITEK